MIKQGKSYVFKSQRDREIERYRKKDTARQRAIELESRRDIEVETGNLNGKVNLLDLSCIYACSG